jgi:hypothetical protein
MSIAKWTDFLTHNSAAEAAQVVNALEQTANHWRLLYEGERWRSEFTRAECSKLRAEKEALERQLTQIVERIIAGLNE